LRRIHGTPGFLERVKKLLPQARRRAASRATGEECEKYPKYFEHSEPFVAQAVTRRRSRQEFLNKP
jgi:hypothetical protein